MLEYGYVKNIRSRHKGIKIIAIILALVGGLHNLSGSFVELVLPNFGPAQGSTGSFNNVFIGILAIFFASITVLATCFIMCKPKIAGWMLIIGAFGGLISVGVVYLISFAFTLTAGVLCFVISSKLKR